MQKDLTTQSNGIREDSLISRCCRFISWQKKSILKSAQVNIAKWKHFGQKVEGQNLPPIFALLIDLYNGNDVFGTLEECRINPDFNSKYSLRNDLEFYVPQLTNFMIFHEELSDYKLNTFLQNLSKADPYFAHLYYWYTNSLTLATDDTKTRDIITNILKICSHEAETQLFFRDYQKFHLAIQKKFPEGEYEKEMKEIQSKQAALHKFIQQYRDDKFKISDLKFESKASHIELRPYISPILQGDQAYSSNPFTSTLLLFEDLYTTAQEMNNVPDKLKFLKGQLRKINKALPSSVYIPFVKESIRSCAILGMVVSETKIFSTKERAPFYICLELFRPQEELAHEYTDLFHPEYKKHKSQALLNWAKKKLGRTKQSNYNKIPDNPNEEISDEEFNIEKVNKLMSSPLKLKQFSSLTRLSPIKEQGEQSPDSKGSTHSSAEVSHRKSSGSSENIKSLPNTTELKLRHSVSSEDSSEFETIGTPVCKGGRFPRLGTPVSSQVSPGKAPGSFTGFFESKGSPEEKKVEDTTEREKCITENDVRIPVRFENDPFFGEDSNAQTQRIRDQSPFRDLKTWRLLHLIVKAGADMKEEQFALQLISQFQQIFKAEKLKLILTPFEIISLGPDIGLVEFVKDSITLSSLKEKMYKQNIPTLKDFFEHYYGKDVEKARKRFCRSLAAYSVICYFLQIKDRHNGNIMLHKKGHIFHLDFGFFLSNAPGKGLEFERKVPFKLLNEYVEVLGGPRSRLFQEFRKLFFKGFMAAHKHREQILILVKMMYSSQGNNLPCFKGGLKSITELEQRFCPIGINEKDMTSYCYTLINQSLDNWRARCYDKYQYYMQGIFY